MFSNVKEKISQWTRKMLRPYIIRYISKHIANEKAIFISNVKMVYDLSDYELEVLVTRLNLLCLNVKRDLIKYYDSSFWTSYSGIKNYIKNHGLSYNRLIKELVLGDNILTEKEFSSSYLLNNDGTRLLSKVKDLHNTFEENILKYYSIWDKHYSMLSTHKNQEGIYKLGDDCYDISLNATVGEIIKKHMALTIWLYVKLLHKHMDTNISNTNICYTDHIGNDYFLPFKHGNYQYRVSRIGVSIIDKEFARRHRTSIGFSSLGNRPDTNKYFILDHICKMVVFKSLLELSDKWYPKPTDEVYNKLDIIYKELSKGNVSTVIDNTLMKNVSDRLYN